MTNVAPSQDAKLLPFYLVIDVSYSMTLNGKMDKANKIVPQLLDALSENPIISDKVRVAVIDFSDDARVVLPLCDLLEQDSIPGLTPRGGTSYSAAFAKLKEQIEADVRQLKADGFKVHRPAVFFLSDGEPSDTENQWRAAFAELTTYDKATGKGFAMYPNVIPLGIDQAKPKILKDLIHPATGPKPMKMYLMDDNQDPGEAIRSMAEVLISSVLQSGSELAAGGSGVALPSDEDLPSGITAHTANDDDFL